MKRYSLTREIVNRKITIYLTPLSMSLIYTIRNTQDIPTTSSRVRLLPYDEFGASSGNVSSADHV